MKTEEINKLPKWAQREVQTLQMRLDEANAELSRLKSNPESNTIAGYGYSHEKPVHYLENNQMITFKLPTGRIRARITKDGFVEINSDGLSEQELFVKPRASNCFYIHLIKELSK